MSEQDLWIEEARLYDHLCATEWLRAGFEQVKKNRGAPGSDGVTIADFESELDGELRQLREELASWTYQPAPVRRVEIPKPGGRGLRLLGVPTVRDRVVQAALKRLLEPIFEPHFSAHSYGFRPGRNQWHAVEAAQRIVTSGKPYVVDLDLEKFFGAPGKARRFQRVRFPPRQGEEPPHREPSLGLMKVTTWVKRRQGDTRAVTQVKPKEPRDK